MNLIRVKDYNEMIERAGEYMKLQVREKKDSVLGLATGRTMVGVYERLIEHYKNKDISFRDVITFNLDEYYPITRENPSSYYQYMMEHLFRHTDINTENIHIPDGSTTDPLEECKSYDKKIEAVGGIDLQLLGIGRNGHIGFNEPKPVLELNTHLTDLDETTIEDNASAFSSREAMPQQAITLGIKKIMEAKKIILLANGREKSEALRKMTRKEVDPRWPASILQLHPDITTIADEEACERLE
ncbi:glucosamine-6-phosphate deaminase [Geosporobacter ferrireducens]|uniref:Glucosamine-6-phosphate deaminase n=1 Tax=Geosporobacter ferrireducens TaxID=1424294 RepID=A0A1D8GNU3_9FIRM|nr:glucosamine-6-phosphate deaminase [Geosporobacter ferrireducens]AOT72616.1 glucosamine-6-phosphate deaminase [Geosporobacter ferrireducens]MTI55018.1 glucosamine-6-phosphate deaminase [Geosporobacter ferrireducens]